jgi:GNAT superfamily N-acetyltransferase
MFFVDSALARRLEVASAWRGIEYARAIQRLHPDLGVAMEAVAGGYAIYTGPSFPVNRASGLGLHGPVGRSELEQVEQFYRSRRALPAVDVCPLADGSWLDLLRAEGYRLECFYNVLVRPLAADAANVAASPAVQVSVTGPEDRELWLRTVAQGFDGRDDPEPGTVAILAANFDSAAATCYLAWIGGQPAGGGSIVVHKGLAELCSASTRPAWRRRGVQTALIGTRLAAAWQAGCDLVTIVTLPGSDSQRNAERAGFRLAYTRVVVVAPE